MLRRGPAGSERDGEWVRGAEREDDAQVRGMAGLTGDGRVPACLGRQLSLLPGPFVRQYRLREEGQRPKGEGLLNWLDSSEDRDP